MNKFPKSFTNYSHKNHYLFIIVWYNIYRKKEREEHKMFVINVPNEMFKPHFATYEEAKAYVEKHHDGNYCLIELI